MKERTALITGASRGIGKAIATRIVEKGIVVMMPNQYETDLFLYKLIGHFLYNVPSYIFAIGNFMTELLNLKFNSFLIHDNNIVVSKIQT